MCIRDRLSTSISNNYQTESRLQDILSYFSYIAISLALIGLFALVTFSLQRRWKEIGLRKVLGANNTQLAWLIGKQFGLLLTAAFVLSAPIGWLTPRIAKDTLLPIRSIFLGFFEPRALKFRCCNVWPWCYLQ